MAKVIHHIVEINPPSPHRKTWLAVCNQGDLSRSYRNAVEARLAANGHVSDVMLQSSLEQGTYIFDDGEF